MCQRIQLLVTINGLHYAPLLLSTQLISDASSTIDPLSTTVQPNCNEHANHTPPCTPLQTQFAQSGLAVTLT